MREVAIDVPLETTRSEVQELIGDLVGKKPSTVNVELKLHHTGYWFKYSADAALIIRRVNVDGIAFDKEEILWKLKNPTKRVLPKAMRESRAKLLRKAAKAKHKNSNKPIVIRVGKRNA